MALPSGVSTFELTFGQTFDFQGVSLKTDLVIVPSHEVRTADGERIVPSVIEAQSPAGEFGSIDLPQPGQTGLYDLKGNLITNWWYTVTATDSKGNRTVGDTKVWKLQPTIDQLVIDLDTIPTDATVGPVGSVTPPAVTSVNGATGAVTVEGATDAGIEAIIADTDSDTYATLNTTIGAGVAAGVPTVGAPLFAENGRSVVGNKWVFLGDSITLGSAGGGETYIRYASTRSEQRIREARNAGVAGETAANMLARFDASVTPYNPDVVHVLAGTNDAGGLRLLSDYAADMRAILAKIRAIGALPVIGSIPPRGTGATQPQMDKIRAFNGWLSRWTATEGITFVDYYGALIDPTTGFLRTTYDFDIVHPTNLGHYAMATELLKVKDAMPYRPPLLPMDVGDTGNILTNGLMLTDAQPDGVPDSWGGGTGSTATVGFTHTIVDDPKYNGKAAQIALSSANGYRKFTQGISGARWAVGQKLAVVARFSIINPTNLTGSDGMKLQLIENNVTIKPVLTDLKQACDGAVMYQEYDVVPGVTSLTLEMLFNANGAGKTVSYRIGQVGVYNLSASGALT